MSLLFTCQIPSAISTERGSIACQHVMPDEKESLGYFTFVVPLSLVSIFLCWMSKCKNNIGVRFDERLMIPLLGNGAVVASAMNEHNMRTPVLRFMFL